MKKFRTHRTDFSSTDIEVKALTIAYFGYWRAVVAVGAFAEVVDASLFEEVHLQVVRHQFVYTFPYAEGFDAPIQRKSRNNHETVHLDQLQCFNTSCITCPC